MDMGVTDIAAGTAISIQRDVTPVWSREVTRERSTPGVVWHLIDRVERDRDVVVVAQGWSCWVSTLSALRMRGVTVFAPLAYQQLYGVEEDLKWEWKSLGAFCATRMEGRVVRWDSPGIRYGGLLTTGVA